MRKHFSSSALPLILILLLAGCEASPYPISGPGDASVTSEFLGDWVATDEDGAELSLTVLPFNEFEYLAIVSAPDEDGPSHFRMYESDVDGLLFANIQCLDCDDDDEEFMFGRLAIIDQAMNTQWLEDEFYTALGDAQSSDDVFRAILAAKTTDQLRYSEQWEWHRVGN